MSLRDYSTDEIILELKRREEEDKQKLEPLTIADIMQLYRIKSRQTAAKIVKKEGIEEGKYIVRKVGRQYLIDRESFMEYLKSGGK